MQERILEEGLFKPIERESTLADRVSDEIERQIMDGRIRVGEKLPPERELARQFNVSRTVIREAVKTLTAKGLLEVRMGSGTVVCSTSASSVAKSISFFLKGSQIDLDYSKIHEVRRILEIEIAGLAAQRRSEEVLNEMKRVIAETAQVVDNRVEFSRLDVEFHRLLQKATGNELIHLLIKPLEEILYQVRLMAYDVAGMTERALAHHEAIFEAVKQKNSEMARQAMRSHLEEAEATMNLVSTNQYQTR